MKVFELLDKLQDLDPQAEVRYKGETFNSADEVIDIEEEIVEVLDAEENHKTVVFLYGEEFNVLSN